MKFDNYNNPMGIYIKSESINFNLNEKINYEYFFTKIEIISDSGILCESMDHVKESYKFQRREISKKDINSIMIKMNDVKTSIYRRYDNLINVFANMGGLIFLIFSITTSLNNIYSEIIFIENIFNKSLPIAASCTTTDIQKTARSKISLKTNKLVELANMKQRTHNYIQPEKVESSLFSKLSIFYKKEKKKYLFEMMKKHVYTILDISIYVKTILLANPNLVKDFNEDFMRDTIDVNST
jgi:hypothetical protein